MFEVINIELRKVLNEEIQTIEARILTQTPRGITAQRALINQTRNNLQERLNQIATRRSAEIPELTNKINNAVRVVFDEFQKKYPND